MTFKELLAKTNYAMIYKYLLKYSYYTNDYEYTSFSHKKQLKIKYALKRKYYKFYNYMKNLKEIPNEDKVIVISKLFDEKDGYKNGFIYSTFMVYKSEVLKKNNGSLTLWNGDENNRVEHYSIETEDFNEVLGYTICPNSLKLNYNLIAALIFIEITTHGFTKNTVKENVNKFVEEIKKQLESIKDDKPKGISIEEVFDNLYEEINGKKETPEEKEIRKQETKLRHERVSKIQEENHKIVINDVLTIK